MLLPDVTTILSDPEVGGGQSFQVKRTSCTRSLGKITKTVSVVDVIGNVQPQDKSSQTSTSEDNLNESIVVYAPFNFCIGEDDGNAYATFNGADEIVYNSKLYRVTRVSDWYEWGFSIAYATRVRDMEVSSE